ncbi:MAG: sigma 54-interacting transcriptional regulator, partial [Anaeromyxobacteraceae bacterium]
PVRVDVRLVCATNRDLEAEVKSGRFREDLYFRINVVTVKLPPLRERPHDIPILITHFLAKIARREGRPATSISREALEMLGRYPWPGNVRELENAVERAVAVARGERIAAADLPAELSAADAAASPAGAALTALPFREAVDEVRDRASREYLVALLREVGGNVTKAAERAGMERESLHRLLKRYGLRSDDYRPE